jgi:2-oxoglutarate ferredoxin oxidoreductase subunit gamma
METEPNPASGTRRIKCAGFGGQGILALGEILAIAGMYEGRNVSWLPSYGPESRGGTCNCDVILSDEEIAAPFVETPDVAFLLNQPSVEKFEPRVAEGGVVFYDSGLAEIAGERPGVRYVGIPFTSMAIELGTERIANMVALGAYLAGAGREAVDAAIRAMRTRFQGKESLFAVNERAIATGIDAGKARGT